MLFPTEVLAGYQARVSEIQSSALRSAAYIDWRHMDQEDMDLLLNKWKERVQSISSQLPENTTVIDDADDDVQVL